MKKRSGLKKAAKITLITLASVVSLWIVILLAVQIVLSPSVLKRIVSNVAAGYVDGELGFSGIRASAFKNFPYLNVSIDSLSVTYPTERFAAVGAGSDWYTSRGRGEVRDTLVSFSEFSASVNMVSLVSGKIHVPGLRLSKPRIFATIYQDGQASWDILKLTDSTAVEDTVESDGGLPQIKLGRIRLVDNPAVVFSSLPDSLRASVIFRRMAFDGALSKRAQDKGTIRFRVDSLFLSGRLPADTLALRLDELRAETDLKSITAGASATTYLATNSFGRMKLPVSLDAELILPEDSSKIFRIPHFNASLAAIPLALSGEFQILDDGLRVKGQGAIEDCKISDVLGYFQNMLPDMAKGLETDAAINLEADFDGKLTSSNMIPALSAKLSVPRSKLKLKDFMDFKDEIAIEVAATVNGDSSGVFNADIQKLYAACPWLNLNVALKAADLLGDDPLFDVKGDFKLDLDSFDMVPEMLQSYQMSGGIDVGLNGKIRLSQMSVYNFPEANISGYAKSAGLKVISEADSIKVYTDSIDVWLGAVGNTRDKSVAKGERMLALTASIDSIDLNYKDAMYLKGKDLSLKAQNSAAIVSRKDNATFYPFGGKFESSFIQFRGADTTDVTIKNTDNIFKISPKAGNKDVPVLSLTSDTDLLALRSPLARVNARKFSVNMTAAMNSIERRKKINQLRDSLAKVYPDIPRDSVLAHVYGKPGKRGPQRPDWITEDDFRKKDFNFRLDQSLAKYYREWDLEGNVELNRLNLMSPLFPLRTSARNFTCDFSNNAIILNKLTLMTGKSWLTINGELTRLRGALLRNSPLALNLNLKADKLDFNEMMAALALGSEFMKSMPENSALVDMDESDFEEIAVVDNADSLAADADALLVIPRNLEATAKLTARNVKYSTLEMKSLTADLVMKDRCVQITNTSGLSDMGNLFFEGFYATRSKEDIKAGFNLNLSDITAEKVIDLVPAIDSLMPMLKSFEGKLGCELAATADIDTTMSIIIPSLNGVIRIGGNNLSMQNDAAIKQVAKILQFKDKETSRIDKMTVEGLLADSRLEIFPFVLAIDRYTLAMSGVQNLDTSFKYHVSVIESPLIFRLGIDLNGSFDDFKFRIGKPKYKSANVPVFSTVIDETKLSLSKSINEIFQKGVENAVEENRRLKAIADFKAESNYVQAVDTQLDSLSADEKVKLEISE